MVSGNVSTGGGNDVVNLNEGAAVEGTIDGDVDGKGGSATITFNMPATLVEIASLDNANVTGDTIAIQGNTYTWANFDTLENNLSLIPPTGNDFNDDGFITPSDAIFVVNRIGQPVTDQNEPADVDGDNDIDGEDVALVLAQIGLAAAP